MYITRLGNIAEEIFFPPLHTNQRKAWGVKQLEKPLEICYVLTIFNRSWKAAESR